MKKLSQSDISASLPVCRATRRTYLIEYKVFLGESLDIKKVPTSFPGLPFRFH
jgi:hypothetical protein